MDADRYLIDSGKNFHRI